MRRMRRMIVVLAVLAVLVSVVGIAAATNITVNGTLSEWASEDLELTDPDDVVDPVEWAYDIMDLYSTTDDNGDLFVGFNTYAALSVTDSAFIRVYLDTDRNPSTGDPKYGMGIDYRVWWDMPAADDSCVLEKYVSGSWQEVGSGDSYCNGLWASDVEISVSGTHVALGNPMEIRLYFDNGTDPSDDSVQWVYESTNGGGEGCTPGYWKQEQHFDSWVDYSPGDFFSDTFGVIYDSDPELTLLEAVWLRGGGEAALARHAVAALLNAANPDVSYEYTDIIAMVLDAYANEDFEGIKNLFEYENELGCPLD